MSEKSAGLKSNSGFRRAPALLALLLALIWAIIVRIPLVINAESHLDSDLAVDGLTLLDMLSGKMRTHFPGTPHIGVAPLFLCLPATAILDVSATSLVTGGAIAYLMIMVACFVLAYRVYGAAVAAWSLVPLTFSSTGLIWLSGRITGGHLFVVAWQAAAFAWLHALFVSPSRARAITLGLWCGLGMWHDSMFAAGLAGMLAASARFYFSRAAESEVLPRTLTKRDLVVSILLATAAGFSPALIGRAVDGYDAYREQFSPIFDKTVLLNHAEILAFDCIPRLAAGHRLPGGESEPAPESLGEAGGSGAIPRASIGASGWATIALALSLFLLSNAVFIFGGSRGVIESSLRFGISVTLGIVVLAFVVNRNIFNSDNYRYLVLAIIPWSLGYGRWADSVFRRGSGGIAVAVGASALLAMLQTVDAARWYQGFGWIDEHWNPSHLSRKDPLRSWVSEHPEVTSIEGGYWDVYRLSFLTDGRVVGVPYPFFPNRFPEASTTLPRGRPPWVLIRPTPEGERIRVIALSEGATEVGRIPGGIILRRTGGDRE